MDFNNTRAMVVGMARSGQASAELLLSLGAEVLLYDQKPKSEFSLDALFDRGAKDCLGADPGEVTALADCLVLSPGVPVKLPFIQEAIAQGKSVLSEIELGFLVSPATFICIGGTNGKTTTTALTGEIFKNAGHNTFVLGNIGTPITEMALETKEGDIIVAETAALQLETIDTFHPRAAALLNVTEDHLDRFGTMEYYTYCKMRQFENMNENDFAVMNLDDPITHDQIHNIQHATILCFSRKEEVATGAFVRDGCIIFKQNGVEQTVCSIAEIKIPGMHNLENALAATCLAMAMGVSAEVVADALRTFPGVEHRIEYVCTVEDIRFINDSKGTNPDATIKAIEAMEAPTVLILGGYDKQSDFDALFAAFTKNIHGIVLLGETKDKLLRSANTAGFANVLVADSFEKAVRLAFEMAERGGNVLFSPACASWDMFNDYEERGDLFKQLAHQLKG